MTQLGRLKKNINYAFENRAFFDDSGPRCKLGRASQTKLQLIPRKTI